MTATIKADWTPHDGQRDILEADARFRIVACGRRWGKTEMSARAAAAVLGDPDTLVWWVGPTYDIADLGFRAVEAALPDAVVADTKRTKPKGLTLVNGSEVSFRSADREDSLRGEGLDLLVLDEAAMIDERAWTNELRPTLSDTLGDMIAISTPKGRGWFYQWFQRGNSADHPDTASWQAPTHENPHVPDSELDDAKHELPERVYRQEYLAEFVNETGGVFQNLDEQLFTADYDLPLSPVPDDVDPADTDRAYAVGPFATGVDFARHQDYRVTIVVDAAGRIVYFDRGQRETWPEIQRGVESVAQTYPGVVSVDASRDNKIVADLEAAGVRVRPVTFSSSRKRQLIEDLIASVEAGELSAPDIPELQHEMEVFEYDVTRGGNVRYDAPQGFHDDTVDALALAADGRQEAAGQAASATARVGGSGDERDGDDLDAVVKQQLRERQNRWK